MGIGDRDIHEEKWLAHHYAAEHARAGRTDKANSELRAWGLRPAYGAAAEAEKPGIGTYLLGAGIALALLWPMITGLMGLVNNSVSDVAAVFPLVFLLPSIGTSPLRGFLGITSAAVIVGSLPLLLAVLIGPARAPRFRIILWVVATLSVAFVVVLGAICWNTVVRAGM